MHRNVFRVCRAETFGHLQRITGCDSIHTHTHIYIYIHPLSCTMAEPIAIQDVRKEPMPY